MFRLRIWTGFRRRVDKTVSGGQSGPDLNTALMRSRSDDTRTRLDAVAELGAFIGHSEAWERLDEMMDDANVTVEVDAAEVLVRHGGKAGLHAVLDRLGTRREDADVDYIAYMLQNLDFGGEFPVIEIANSIDVADLSPMAKLGLRDLRRLMFSRWDDPD
ncbi:hypothetical protein ACFVUS_38655 [Nocardia sp. NPDC058058]|uniref:hypothetical protein n=1 Tax=Nocardia sp. NPDC058058 TaxID=3346317 RepID=UPI0036D9C18C